MIEMDLLWEVLQEPFQRNVYVVCFEKKKQTIKKLTINLNLLEENLPQHLGNKTWLENIKERNKAVEEMREHKLKGALIRLRWQNKDMGETHKILP